MLGVVRTLEREEMTQIPIQAPPITAHELLGIFFFLGVSLPFGLYEGKVLSKVSSSFNLQFLA